MNENNEMGSRFVVIIWRTYIERRGVETWGLEKIPFENINHSNLDMYPESEAIKQNYELQMIKQMTRKWSLIFSATKTPKEKMEGKYSKYS